MKKNIGGWSHAEGMTSCLNASNIRIFDFSNFSQPLTEQIRADAQRIADENGIEIEFIRKLRNMNGHSLPANKLQKKETSYCMHDNAFLEISDVEAAQKLSDRINPEALQLFTIMKAANYRYLELISSFDGHSGGKGTLQRLPIPLWTRGALTAG